MSSTLGKLHLSTAQAKQLQVKAGTRWSPYFEKCGLLVSANASYQNAEIDLEMLTGIRISHSTLQRLVQRQEYSQIKLDNPIEAVSVDGGMVRVRTAAGQACEWREYKALRVHNQANLACFKENHQLLKWVNAQPLAAQFTALGDGHDGVWNILSQIGSRDQRVEVLDWFHLMEHVNQVQAPSEQLEKIKQLLWQGMSSQAIQDLCQHECQGSTGLIQYLRHHASRIIDYEAWQTAGHPIGSGHVESLVKQIALRVKLPGAQWRVDSVAKVLKHRCAYLNGAFAA